MWFIGAVAVLLIIASLGNEIRLAGLERKKVSKISEIAVPEVPDVKTERAYGVVSAAEWSAYYSDIYKSYMDNEGNTGHGGVRVKYTETDPDIQTLYSGYGFAIPTSIKNDRPNSILLFSCFQTFLYIFQQLEDILWRPAIWSLIFWDTKSSSKNSFCRLDSCFYTHFTPLL